MKYLLILIIPILAGCFAEPVSLDTNNKKLLAAEESYRGVAELALQSKDRMSASTREDVKELLLDAHKALVAARQALSLGNDLDFSTQLTTANSIIRTLRPILESMEEAREQRIESYSFA